MSPNVSRKRKLAAWEESVPTRRVKSLTLHALSGSDTERLSVAEITHATMYDKCRLREGSLLDRRMGVVDPRLRCLTCRNDAVDCTGHQAHMRLPVVVYHVAHIANLVKLLRAICPRCLRLIVPHSDGLIRRAQHLQEEQRFNLLTNLLKSKRRCAHCSLVLPKFVQHGLSIAREWGKDGPKDEAEDEAKEEAKEEPSRRHAKRKRPEPQACSPSTDHVPAEELRQPLSAQKVRDMLLLVDQDEFRALGLRPELSHPADWLLDRLLVPPPAIRPSLVSHGNTRIRAQDDLTQSLLEILKTLQRLAKPDLKDKERAHAQLQLQIATYMNSDACTGANHLQLKRRSGRPTKSVAKRLKGKKGRFRGNLNGKRVDFCARDVITPDPYIAVGEIGVPSEIAFVLTQPEVVTVYNLRALQQRVSLGAKSLQGAHSVHVKASGDTLSLKLVQSYQLRLGDTVHRYLQDGDWCLVNRQPTLRQKSILAHRVRLVSGRTLRLNPVECPCFGADYDGDERRVAVRHERGLKKERACRANTLSVVAPVVALVVALVAHALVALVAALVAQLGGSAGPVNLLRTLLAASVRLVAEVANGLQDRLVLERSGAYIASAAFPVPKAVVEGAAHQTVTGHERERRVSWVVEFVFLALQKKKRLLECV